MFASLYLKIIEKTNAQFSFLNVLKIIQGIVCYPLIVTCMMIDLQGDYHIQLLYCYNH